MSQARREALLARAYELGAIIIEDDYDSEFRYEGRPADSLQSLDERGIVAYVGTFSKTLLPELRLGYAILPPAILEAVILAKRLTDQHTSTLPQWALAKFIAEGCLLKHIRRCHTLYAGRRERILARMGGDLSPWFEAVPTTAGFHMAVLCKVPMDLALVIELAKKAEVGLYSLDGFFQRGPGAAGPVLWFWRDRNPGHRHSPGPLARHSAASGLRDWTGHLSAHWLFEPCPGGPILHGCH